MARVPLVTSPCPLRWNSVPKPGQDFCGHCERQVHNLDLLSRAEREAFLAGCQGKVCVTYTVRRPVRAAIMVGAGLAAAAALSGAADVQAPSVTVMEDSPYCDPDLVEVIVGGTEAGEKLQWVDEKEAALAEKPELPAISASDWLPTPQS